MSGNRPPHPGPEPQRYINNMPHLGTTSEWTAWQRRKQAWDSWTPPPPDSMERRYTPPKAPNPRGVPDDIMTMGRTPGYNQRGGNSTTNDTVTNPTPPSPPKPVVQKAKDVKVATRDLFMTEDKTVGEQTATARIFQDIAGIELLSVARNYSINGITQEYNPISNIADLSFQYSPFNIIPLQGIDRSYFNQYEIDLSRRLPDFPNNPDGSTYNVYIDRSNNIVIEVANLAPGEKIEIEFLTSEESIGWYN
jgi:hypothetical protein